MQALEVLARARPWLASHDHTVALLDNGAATIESVPTALAAFLAHPDDPAQAFRWAIRARRATAGDTAVDTVAIASMAGAIAAARTGARQLPSGWPKRLESAPVLLRLADGLAPQHQGCRSSGARKADSVNPGGPALGSRGRLAAFITEPEPPGASTRRR